MSLLLAKPPILMRNNELRPPGSTPLHEANKVAKEKKESKESNHVQDDRPHGHGRGG